MATHETRQAASVATARRAATASLIGTTIEWYDYFLFGIAAALVFGELFFTSLSPASGTLAALATFGVAFIARPLGGVIFGHFGDRVGRKKMLVVSLLLMGIGTIAIGLLPTYDQVGVLAPILLVAFRLLQGLAVGGEWSGAVLIAVEHAPPGRRGLYGSAAQVGVPLGLMLGTGSLYLASAALTQDQFLAWGWRIPFIASVALVGVGIYIRLQLEETPAFKNVRETKQTVRYPIVQVLKEHKAALLRGSLVQGTANVPFYIATVYILSYGTTELGLSRNFLLFGVMVAAGVDVLTLPIAAHLSDRFGRRPMITFGTLFFAAYAFPFFWIVNLGSGVWVVIALIPMLAVGHACTYGIIASYLAELFEARVRYTGSAAAYQLGGLIWSAPAPFAAAALFAWTGHWSAIAAYILFACIVTLAAVWAGPETSKSQIDEEASNPGADEEHQARSPLARHSESPTPVPGERV